MSSHGTIFTWQGFEIDHGLTILGPYTNMPSLYYDKTMVFIFTQAHTPYEKHCVFTHQGKQLVHVVQAILTNVYRAYFFMDSMIALRA
jgi:hypothetical protein